MPTPPRPIIRQQLRSQAPQNAGHYTVYLPAFNEETLSRPVRTLTNAQQFATAGLAPGVYVLRAEDGASSKLVVR